ncbi:cutinase-domain-containing protein [Colletotrichum acutatum]|uniref:Cutinase-domain-containing protein n=1 Tax=Glomerella acutata TaxID=27357 RepID=A0AAD8XBE2_GLOAC|nr:cutinase-domain-containing protein [Colletotrichum acutatum]KAK1718057.1 cutinase-domain-containing protein [Colletotrichum acutatum]
MSVISEIPKEALAADVKTPISAHGGCGGGPLRSRCRWTCRSLSSQTLFFSSQIPLLDFDLPNKTHGHLLPPVVIHLLGEEIHLLREEQYFTVERMQPQISLSALAALIPMVLALPQQQPPPPGPPAACAPVNIIVARGSLEAQGAGLLGNIAMNASMQIPGSVITPLVYPAQLDPYPPSVSAGVMNMTTLLNQQAQQCPQSKLVLMGYSQGAQVSLDTLCGTTDGPNFNTTVAQAPMVGSKIAAVVLFGDPTFIAGQPFAKGTSKKNGIFPRMDLGPCQSLTSKFASFCDDTDLFCASGQNLTVHLGYFSKQDYVAQASSFIVQQTK